MLRILYRSETCLHSSTHDIQGVGDRLPNGASHGTRPQTRPHAQLPLMSNLCPVHGAVDQLHSRIMQPFSRVRRQGW